MNESPKNHVPVLEKTIRLLDLIARGEESTNSSNLAKRSGMSQSTCYRILKTLEGADWIRSSDRGGYGVSLGLMPLLQPLMDFHRIAEAVRPVLDDLAWKSGMSAKLCARRDREQITLAAGKPRVPIGILTPEGVPYSLVVGASGAALLAHLEESNLEEMISATPLGEWRYENPGSLRARIAECHQSGFCSNIGNHPQGIDTLACPLNFGRVPLALSLIGLRGEFAAHALTELRALLGSARSKCEHRLANLDLRPAA